MEGVFIFKKSRYESEEEYKVQVGKVLDELLVKRLQLFHINSKDINSEEHNKKYNIGSDTFKSISNPNKTLRKFKAFGIEILRTEEDEEQMKISLVLKNPNYSKSIGEPTDWNFIPSTIAFIKDFQPQSGYKREQ